MVVQALAFQKLKDYQLVEGIKRLLHAVLGLMTSEEVGCVDLHKLSGAHEKFEVLDQSDLDH